MSEFTYLLRVIICYKHPKLIWREMVCHWYRTGNDIIAPKEIYDAIDRDDIETAQKLLNKQCEFWNQNDPALMRAQSYIDMS